jgi:hypothetical protein
MGVNYTKLLKVPRLTSELLVPMHDRRKNCLNFENEITSRVIIFFSTANFSKLSYPSC